jgi:hypothetical protein
MTGKHRFRRIVPAIIFAIVLMGVYMIVNIGGYYVPILNPAPSQQSQSVTIDYFPHDNALYYPVVRVNLTIVSNGPIVARQPVTVIVQGQLYTPWQNVTKVIVGVKSLLNYPPVYNKFGIANTPGIWLTPVQTPDGIALGTQGPIQYTLEFPSEGSYAPTMTVNFTNGASHGLVFDDNKITVSSPSVIVAQRGQNLEHVFSVAIVFFAFIEGIDIVRQVYKD